MVLDTFDDLIVFVPFSCDEDDIILLRECAGGVDGALAVFDDEGAAQFVLGEPRRHVA